MDIIMHEEVAQRERGKWMHHWTEEEEGLDGGWWVNWQKLAIEEEARTDGRTGNGVVMKWTIAIVLPVEFSIMQNATQPHSFIISRRAPPRTTTVAYKMLNEEGPEVVPGWLI